MRYLLLLYGDEEGEAALGDDGRRAIVAEHAELRRRLREGGALVVADALEPPSRAKLLRRDASGRPLVIDGPFAETKEQLGGFYVIECAGDGEALAWAEQVPISPGLVVEVRPLAGM